MFEFVSTIIRGGTLVYLETSTEEPPRVQKGTPWLPAANATDEKFNLDRVEILIHLFNAQSLLFFLGALAWAIAFVECKKTQLKGLILPYS